MQREMLGYFSVGPGRAGQSTLWGSGIDLSRLQGTWVGAFLLPTLSAMANLVCDTPPLPQLASWGQKNIQEGNVLF